MTPSASWKRQAASAFLATLATVSAASAAMKVGDVAPDFSLPATDGSQVSLASLRGEKNVVLAFFPKAFTAG